MFYITHYNRFGKKYTSQKVERPQLTIHPTLDTQQLYFLHPYALPLTDADKEYTTFRIPKASGGYRTINAPSERLKDRQRLIVNHLQNHCKILETPWAYAYVKGLSAIDALRKHQENQSKWFLKLDIKDFFPSCTQTKVLDTLRHIFPICSWNEADKLALDELLIEHCFFGDNPHLPQGAVTSPFLSNLVMVPHDWKIADILRNAQNHGLPKQKYVYTRYADDIIISSKGQFDWHIMQRLIQEQLTPEFILKAEKTRYGSSAGRNWNLGCMLNVDNNITIGHKQKEEWKRKMMDIIIRFNNNAPIPLAERQQLMGLLSYYRSIEPDYFNYLIRHYHEKYQVNFETIIKAPL